ncbi:MAG: hypothetical protein J0L75_10150 [Spirochaetes bacterium]|nr:hypothetical protein [Spirochaetota bacterium]
MPGEHDLSLPAWGPYSKKTSGIAHTACLRRGLRVDFALFPGLFRRRIDPAMARWESGWHPWEADVDLTAWSVRHELGGLDDWYAQMFWCSDQKGSPARYLRARFHNRTGHPQNAVLHFMASLQSHHPLQTLVRFSGPGHWVNGVAYTDHRRAKPRHDDGLVPDAYRRDEATGGDWVDGRALGKAFGDQAGDTARYRTSLDGLKGPLVLTVRGKVLGASPALFRLDGDLHGDLVLDRGKGQPALAPGEPAAIQCWSMEIGDLSNTELHFDLVALGGKAEINGFALTPKGHPPAFETAPYRSAPECAVDAGGKSMILTWPDLEASYLLCWDWPDWEVREFQMDDFSSFIRDKTHDHVSRVLRGEGRGHHTNLHLAPIPVKPRETVEMHAMVACGSKAELEVLAKGFFAGQKERAPLFTAAEKRLAPPPFLPSGAAHEVGAERLAATLAQNCVFPVANSGQFTRHHTPGRWWDSLYTWDSGMIGLGLLERSSARAAENLRAYLSEPGDRERAFVHHGTPLPVQAWLFHEIWNRTQDREWLSFFYPRMRQYYRFLAGHDGGSTTRHLKSNLLVTWDYFYNSGGWDDYPPQWALNDPKEHARRRFVSPCAPTSHAIRFAKILRGAARLVGAEADLPMYTHDIEAFSLALHTHAWDGSTGYFSYVEHREGGMPMGVFRHASGANWNMGLDGVSPLVAGICTTEQERALVGHLFDPASLWTPVGLSTVDQGAPYFSKRGYWNGAVWFPHQWFIFKALLDLGRWKEARQIAETALSVWEGEVRQSGYAFEHFMVESGRGAGWHHFSGLSSVVLSFFGARHARARVTGGADFRVLEERWDPAGGLVLSFETDGEPGRPFCLWVNGTGNGDSLAHLDGAPLTPSDSDGARRVFCMERKAGLRRLVLTPA